MVTPTLPLKKDTVAYLVLHDNVGVATFESYKKCTEARIFNSNLYIFWIAIPGMLDHRISPLPTNVYCLAPIANTFELDIVTLLFRSWLCWLLRQQWQC